jgi:hypothetical protein
VASSLSQSAENAFKLFKLVYAGGAHIPVIARADAGG